MGKQVLVPQLRDHVLEKLYNRTQPLETPGLEEPTSRLAGMLKDSVEYHRGSSVVLVGPHGSGKSLVVDKALEQLSATNSGEYLLIRISAWLAPEDRNAIRELARQLDAQISGRTEERAPIEKLSNSMTTQSVARLFDEAAISAHEGEKSVAVVVVVDNIDKYAVGPRQTFLHLLFSLAAESPVGIAVVGTTTRINLDEMMEKRIRSRFSQWYLSVVRPRSLDLFAEVGRALLNIDDSGLCQQFSQEVQEWTRYINDSDDIRQIVKDAYYTTKNARFLASQLIPLVVGISSQSCKLLNTISTSETLTKGMPELDWAILICAARAQTRYEDMTESINMVLVMDEYRDMMRELQLERAAGLGFGGYRTWSARAIRQSWERLQHIELLVAITATTTTTTQEELKMYKPEMGLHDLREIMPKSHPLYPWTQL